MENNQKPYLRTYEKIREKIYGVHLYWEIFKQIYAGKKKRYSIMNKAALRFFHYSQDVYLAYVESGLMRLLDAPSMFGKRDKNRMSIPKLIEEIESVEKNTKLNLRLKRLEKKLKEKTKTLKIRRNKARSHNDYKVACGVAQVPLISRKYVKDALCGLMKLMAVIESHMGIEGLDECAFIEANNSARELFSCLDDGLKYRNLVAKDNV